MTRGRAIRTTSSGKRTSRSPLSENITRIVNSRATSVSGLMRGTKRVRYQGSPLSRMRANRVRNPAANGTPRYRPTLFAISPIPMGTTTLPKPNHLGSTVRNAQAYRL